MDSDSRALLEKIHQQGYWRILMRPSEYQERRLPTLARCWEIIEKCEVSLRGWNYPHQDYRARLHGNDYVASRAHFMGNIEYWQLFQSGQFVHHLACREDYEGPAYRTSTARGGPFLDFISTLYTCTELFEFAARLAANEVFGSSVEISVRLVGMKGRRLGSWDPARHLSMSYVCELEEIMSEQRTAVGELVARSADLALDSTQFIYERFGWTHSSREMLAEDQRRLLDRAL